MPKEFIGTKKKTEQEHFEINTKTKTFLINGAVINNPLESLCVYTCTIILYYTYTAEAQSHRHGFRFGNFT